MEKMTKAMYFEVIRGIVEGLDAGAFPDGVGADDVLDFIDRQVELLDKRAAASKERAAKKRAASDELTELIYTMIFEAEDFITADEIVEKIGDEEVTKNKVTARVSKLVKAGRVAKEQVKLEDGKKRMAYKVAEEGEDVEAEAETDAE
jgi:hypothetical protein